MPIRSRRHVCSGVSLMRPHQLLGSRALCQGGSASRVVGRAGGLHIPAHRCGQGAQHEPASLGRSPRQRPAPSAVLTPRPPGVLGLQHGVSTRESPGRSNSPHPAGTSRKSALGPPHPREESRTLEMLGSQGSVCAHPFHPRQQNQTHWPHRWVDPGTSAAEGPQ